MSVDQKINHDKVAIYRITNLYTPISDIVSYKHNLMLYRLQQPIK